MARRVGRPKKGHGKKGKGGCAKIAVYRRVKGAIRKVKGVRRKSCLTHKK